MAGDVTAIHAGAVVSKPEGIDHHQIRIGENRKVEPELLDDLGVLLDRVYADGQYFSSQCMYIFDA